VPYASNTDKDNFECKAEVL